MEREEFIAIIRHIAWVSYQIAAGQPYNEEPNDDQLQSLLDGIAFQDANPNMTSDENHENWMKEKIRQGWVYGDFKDFMKKTHPDLVPYSELPEIEKRKDQSSNTAHRQAIYLWNKLNKGE